METDDTEILPKINGGITGVIVDEKLAPDTPTEVLRKENPFLSMTKTLMMLIVFLVLLSFISGFILSLFGLRPFKDVSSPMFPAKSSPTVTVTVTPTPSTSVSPTPQPSPSPTPNNSGTVTVAPPVDQSSSAFKAGEMAAEKYNEAKAATKDFWDGFKKHTDAEKAVESLVEASKEGLSKLQDGLNKLREK